MHRRFNRSWSRASGTETAGKTQGREGSIKERWFLMFLFLLFLFLILDATFFFVQCMSSSFQSCCCCRFFYYFLYFPVHLVLLRTRFLNHQEKCLVFGIDERRFETLSRSYDYGWHTTGNEKTTFHIHPGHIWWFIETSPHQKKGSQPGHHFNLWTSWFWHSSPN